MKKKLTSILNICLTVQAFLLFILSIYGLKYIDSHQLKNASGWITSAILFLLWLFDHYIWKWRLISILIGTPNIEGTWEGILHTFDSTNNQPSISKKVYLVIEQTFFSAEFRLMTDESTSTITSCSIDEQSKNSHSLTGTYRNDPKIEFRNKSNIHYGAVKLDIKGTNFNKLEGHYWTDRKSQGSLIFEKNTRKKYNDFNEAKKFFESNAQSTQ